MSMSLCSVVQVSCSSVCVLHDCIIFIAQLVEHCTGIMEDMGSNPVGAFFWALFVTASVITVTITFTCMHCGAVQY